MKCLLHFPSLNYSDTVYRIRRTSAIDLSIDCGHTVSFEEETRYLITKEKGNAENINISELSGRLEAVVYDKATERYGKEKVLDCFLTHLDAAKKIIKLGFDKSMLNNPYLVVQVVKRPVVSNNFAKDINRILIFVLWLLFTWIKIMTFNWY